MALLDRHSAAPVANILHGRQFVLADMLGIDLRRTAETAFLGISAGIAQVPRCVCHSAAIFTCISHLSLLFKGLCDIIKNDALIDVVNHSLIEK